MFNHQKNYLHRLGGQDPLDYISMYYNAGNIELNIPPHWHYISFGLSDLHGDGRVHQQDSSTDFAERRSGMGFELTFRLIRHKTEPTVSMIAERPPTWPANLLQALARYVFQTGNRLCAGDNVPWRKSLDNNSPSKILHMLIANDPQMPRTQTPYGWVDFCQIVGVTDEELEQASRWNGNGVLNLLRKDQMTGGEWLITDMSRGKSVFEMFPETLRQLENDLENQGSDLAGVNAEFTFKELPATKIKTEIDTMDNNITTATTTGTTTTTTTTNTTMDGVNSYSTLSNSSNSCNTASIQQHSIKIEENLLPNDNDECEKKFLDNSLTMSCPFDQSSALPIESSNHVISLDGLHLTLAPYAAKFLMLAIRDRIRHGRHFTFKCQNLAVTFVSESVTGAVVTKLNPYGVLGYWMQVLISDDLIPKMIDAFKELTINDDKMVLPKHFEWPDKNLIIDIDNPTMPGCVVQQQQQQQQLVHDQKLF